MSVTAATLLLISAFMHAGWNFISKKEHPTLAFYFVAGVFGALFVLPITVFYYIKIVLIPADVWIFVNISALFLAGYMAALAGAYTSGDISIVYPVARSLPAIFVTSATMIFGLGKTLSALFVIGVLLIVGGCIMLPMQSYRHHQVKNYLNSSFLLAIAAAICIAGYTIVDHQALARLRNLPGTPFRPVDAALLYMVLEAVCAAMWKGVFVMSSRRERVYLYEVLCDFKGSAAITGIGIFLTYGLVLASMNYVTNVSYVAAFRQLSIPLGAMSGMVFLHEPHYVSKIAGVFLIFTGLILVTVT
jgi:drug/metabolite transporter (DMT)-like permease